MKAVIDAYRRTRRRGLPGRVRPEHHRQLRAYARSHRGALQGSGDQRHGTDDWLGEWTFAFPQGSMTDEPIFLADLSPSADYPRSACLVEQSLIGETYLKNLRSACARKGIRSLRRWRSLRPLRTSTKRCALSRTRRPRRSCTCGFGFGIVFINPALEAVGLGSAPLHHTAFQNAWVNPIMWNAFMGWIGVDQYDEAQPDRAGFSRPLREEVQRQSPRILRDRVNRDVAATLVRAFTDSHPLSPRGVKEALERVKMMPAASGAPGTRVSFGKWTRRAWMGAGYLVARTLDADGINSHLVDRFGEEG